MVGKFFDPLFGNTLTVDILRKAVEIAGAVLLAVIATAAMVDAGQREYLIGPALNVVGGVQNALPGTGGIGANQSLPATYGFFPTLNLTSRGATSTLDAAYSFGVDRSVPASRGSRSDSHSVTIGLIQPLTQRWNLNLSESFTLSEDTNSFNTFRGVTPTLPNVNVLAVPAGLIQSARNNSVAMTLSHTLSARSSISFDANHSLRTTANNRFPGILSDQQRASGGFTYSLQANARETWSFGFSSSRNFFESFDDSRSHTAFLGYSTQITSDLVLDLTVGASRVASLGPGAGYVGYNTSITVSRASLSVNYNQSSGQQSGVGSTSDTRRVTATINRTLGNTTLLLNVSGFVTRRAIQNPFNNSGATGSASLNFGNVNLSANVSGTKTENAIDSAFDNHGVAATVSIGVQISDTMSVQGGGSFQQFTQASSTAVTQKRVFVSLNFSDPNLWRFIR